MMKDNERRIGRIAAQKWFAAHPEFTGCGLSTHDGIWDLLVNVHDAYTPAERLYFCLMGIDDFNRDRTDSAAFWESVLDAAHPDVDELYEFAACILEEVGPLSEEEKTEEDEVGDDDDDEIVLFAVRVCDVTFYCNDNDETLTSDQLDAVHAYLDQNLDPYDLICEAIHHVKKSSKNSAEPLAS